MDDTDDRFVARRGSQGDDWHWEGATPPEPAAGPGGGLLGPLKSAAGWLGSRLSAARDWLAAPRPAKEAPSADTQAPAKSPERPSEASQAAADTAQASISNVQPPRDAGSAIKWSRIVPRLPSARPRVAIPWSRVAGERPKLARQGIRQAEVPRDTGSLLFLLASVALAAAIVAGVIIAVQTLDTGGGGNGGIVNHVTETPKTTLIPPASQTPRPTASPSPTASASPSPTASASASPSASPTPTPRRTATPTAAPPAPPGPQGTVAAGLWANVSGGWWFGAMTGTGARYEEGQTVPLIIRWDAVAGQTYQVHITYDCAADSSLGAIDYLSGVQGWGSEIINAAHGPAKSQPDAAVLSPDIPNFTPDDGDSGVISLYGGTFPLLPDAPSPGGACAGRRSVTLPVRATEGTVTIVASGHLGQASVYGSGHGAASAASPLSVIVSVDGVGAASTSIAPSAIADVEH